MGYFITVEGIEGAGKSSAMQRLAQHLRARGIAVVVTREPGGTPIAEEIRGVMLRRHEEPMVPETELLLAFAGRAQHVTRVIRPALAAGQWVVCDRFTDASYAYQGGGRGIAPARIAALEAWVQGDLRPDLVLLLDVPAEVGFARAQKRGTAIDRIEGERLEFFKRVRRSYLERAVRDPDRYVVIDATQPPMQVQAELTAALDRWLQQGGH